MLALASGPSGYGAEISALHVPAFCTRLAGGICWLYWYCLEVPRPPSARIGVKLKPD